MNEREEKIYDEGQRSAWRMILLHAVKELGYRDEPAVAHHRWILEREAAVAQLRMACREHGDNDWPDDLHLADVIDKHLMRWIEVDDGPDDEPDEDR